MTKETAYSIGDELCSLFPFLEAERSDEGHDTVVRIREKDSDPLLGKSVSLSIGDYEGQACVMVGFYGESTKANGYSPAVVSMEVKDEDGARAALRLAVACAFNVDAGLAFAYKED